MANSTLEIKSYAHIISGGYAGEIVGSHAPYENWTVVEFDDDYKSGSQIGTYHYRDSYYSDNKRSTEVIVKIEDKWEAWKLAGNVYKIHTKTRLLSIERVKPSDSNGQAGPLILGIWAAGNADDQWGKHVPRTDARVLGTIWQGNIIVSEQTYTLRPQQSANRGTVYYKNYVHGHWQTPVPSPFVDEFWMGITFRNNSPNKLEPPVLSKIEQDRDICERCSIVEMTFEGASLLGLDSATLRLELVNDGDKDSPENNGWETAKVYEQIATPDTPTKFKFNCLSPTSKYKFRASYVGDEGVEASDYSYGDFETLFIPSYKMTVPDVTPSECAEINKGNLIPPYEKPTKYKG